MATEALKSTAVTNADPATAGEERESDAALRRTVTDHPNYDKWYAGLLQSYRAQPLVALAIESGRSCYGRFHGDEFMLSSFHRMMEEGF